MIDPLPPDSLWRASTPDTPVFPRLEDRIRADVVIVGGGYTGVSAAWHLARMGVSVVLLEARTIGFGGSGRNVGLVNAGLWTPPDDVEARIGTDAGARLNAALATGPDVVFDLIERLQIRCEAVRNGTLHCAHSAAGLRDLEKRHAQQIARDAPVRLLDADETRRRTGSAALFGAVWDGRAGTIQPLAYVQGLARAAGALGAQIFENSAVIGMAEEAQGWTVSTAAGSVAAARLIQATNAYGIGGARRNPVVPAHFFQLSTEPLPQHLRAAILPGQEGCWDTAMIMSSFRIDKAGRLILGALGNLDGIAGGSHAAWARRKLNQLFPQIGSVGFEFAWTGRIAMTRSYLPRVDAIGNNGVSIFGYSGRGIAPGTLFGRCAAEWATGTGGFPVEITPPGHSTSAQLKAAYIETGATLTHLIDLRF